MPSYFHVFLSVESAPEDQRCVFSDLDEAGLKASFIKPFKEGNNILCANEVIPFENIRKFVITATDERSEDMLNEYRKNSRETFEKYNRQSRSVVFIGGLGFSKDDLARIGTDVTSKFIHEPPPRFPNSHLHIRLLNNPWVVSIAGGVIVAGIVAWLKWN